MLDPALKAMIDVVFVKGFTVLAAAIAAWFLWAVLNAIAKALPDFLAALLNRIKRSDHEHMAANEQLAHIAQSFIEREMVSEPTKQRLHELSNGGPRGTLDEILVHTLNHGEMLGQINVRLEQGDAWMKRAEAIMEDLQRRMDHAVKGTEQYEELRAEFDEIQRLLGMRQVAAGGE